MSFFILGEYSGAYNALLVELRIAELADCFAVRSGSKGN